MLRDTANKKHALAGFARSAVVGLWAFPLTIGALDAAAEPTPFANGDQLPEVAASCENLRHWIDRAPEAEHRVDMSVAGPLAHVEFDGTLAYLVVCPSTGPQVLCVTYDTNGMKAGDYVRMSGGFQRIGPDKVMLDPCLAFHEPM